MDTSMAVHTRTITYALQTLVEQGISLITRRLLADGIEIAAGVTSFTELLRIGAPPDPTAIRTHARDGLRQHADAWRALLGELVYANTLLDLS